MIKKVFLMILLLTTICSVTAEYGEPVISISGSMTPTIEEGDYGTLVVTVSEIGGEDNAISVTVSPYISDSSITISPSYKTASTISKNSAQTFYFDIYAPEGSSGSKSGTVYVSYYEYGGMDVGTYGPYSETASFSFDVEESTGSLYVTSSPSGAGIYIDGSYKGTTPKTISGLSAGSHSLELTYDGYESYSDYLYVYSGYTSDISTTLSQSTGSLYVTSSPSGAGIYIDGSYKGTTPKTISGLSAGSHSLELTYDGYESYVKYVSIEAGSSNSITNSLTPITTSPTETADTSETSAATTETQSSTTTPTTVTNDNNEKSDNSSGISFIVFLGGIGLLAFLGMILSRKKKNNGPPNTENKVPVQAVKKANPVDTPVTNSKDKTIETKEKLIEPDISLNLKDLEYRINEWKKTELVFKNNKKLNIKNISLKFQNDVETSHINSFKLDSWELKNVEFSLKAKSLGKIPLKIQISFEDELGNKYSKIEQIWINVLDIPKQKVAETMPVEQPEQVNPISRSSYSSTYGLPIELTQNYQNMELVGRGGFAKVYKALKNGKEVAVKVPLSLDSSTGKSFIKELENWTKLKHENIVSVMDYNILPVPYFEMEYCDNSLDKLKKPMKTEESAWIIFNALEGLKYAHNKNIVHRDLKPQNILIKDGIPKIADWGLSKVSNESRSSTMGSFTPSYAAPEQISNKPKDFRTDIWQIGVILYELTTGRLPFEGDSFVEVGMAIATSNPVIPSQYNSNVSALEPVILKCLEKSPDDRYSSVSELQKDLADYLGIICNEHLKESINIKDIGKSGYYCGDLLILNMKIGNMVQAYKYASDLATYSKGDVKNHSEELSSQLKLRIDSGIDSIPEELIEKAELIVHQIRLGGI